MKYTIWCPELDETEEGAHVFVNQFVALAVEEWARVQDIDSDDIILNSGVYTVMVKDEAGVVTPYTVWGELVPRYHVAVKTVSYRVWCPAEGVEEAKGTDILAASASDAACQWAMQMDMERGCTVMGKMSYSVHVRDVGVRVFEVHTKWDLVSEYRTAKSSEIK